MEKAYKYQKWNQYDDIGLEIPYVETNLISTTCNRWWIFEVWYLTSGTLFSLQWDYYTRDKLEKVLVSKHPTCRVISPEICAHKYVILVGNMHIDFRIKNTTWKMTSHEWESFLKMIFGRNYLQFGLWHILDVQSKDKLCVVLLNNFKPYRIAARNKNEMEQAYHMRYLVYAWQKI